MTRPHFLCYPAGSNLTCLLAFAYGMSCVLQWLLLGADYLAPLFAAGGLLVVNEARTRLQRWHGHLEDMRGMERIPPRGRVSQLLSYLTALLISAAGWFVAWNLIAGFCGDGACAPMTPMIPMEAEIYLARMMDRAAGYVPPDLLLLVPILFLVIFAALTVGKRRSSVRDRPPASKNWKGHATVLLPVYGK